jgi:cobalt-precorrin 5A hydrolase
MIVAGFGFRSGVSLASLQEALARAGGPGGVTHLATLDAKARELGPLADALGVPVLALDEGAVAGVPTLTRSARVAAMFGAGSVAEAVALAAAGKGARLRGPRAVSADGTATAAIAEGTG